MNKYVLSAPLLVLLGQAKEGKWDEIDAVLKDEGIKLEDLNWAMWEGKSDDNDEVRDFAATLFNISNLPLDQFDQAHVHSWMWAEENEIVQGLLAIALYKRGSRHPEVVACFEKALKHPDLAAVAEPYRKPQT